MISSMDTDLIPQDYISHCDALLQSFNARYAILVRAGRCLSVQDSLYLPVETLEISIAMPLYKKFFSSQIHPKPLQPIHRHVLLHKNKVW